MTNLLPNGGYNCGPISPQDSLILAAFPGGHVAMVPAKAMVTMDSLDIDPLYDDLFLDEANEDHYNGCASSRNRPCNCEYLGQWK